MPRIYIHQTPTCHPERKHQARGLCRACYSHVWRYGHPDRVRHYRKTTGKTWHDLHRDHINRRAKERWHALTPEQKRFKTIQKTYGISKEMYLRILEAQGNACLICKEKRPDLVIDHDHSRGTRKGFRGIVCDRCNKIIGLIECNRLIIKSVLRYLHISSL